jgi:pyruvate formate lyase activating enzyme
MTAQPTARAQPPLEAKSPFELRVGLSKSVSTNFVKESLETGDTGFLHSFTTGSTVDGPGVRLVAWTAGCQFKCLYCHNPDTWSMSNGMPVPLERAFEEINKYKNGLKIMSGGFTLSGGEPLMQDRFATRLFAAARNVEVHTALDTNGTLGGRLSDEELETIDLVMLCIKTLDPKKHLALTGKHLEPTLEFAKRLAERKRPMWLRYVLVPGWTDSTADVTQMAELMAKLGNCERVDMLPFHQLGRFKWERLGLDYKLGDLEPPSPEAVEMVCEHFRSVGLKAY